MSDRYNKYSENNLLFLEEDSKKEDKISEKLLDEALSNEDRANYDASQEQSYRRTYRSFVDSDKAVEDYINDTEKAEDKIQYQKLFGEKEPIFSKKNIKSTAVNIATDVKSGVIWFAMFFASLFALYSVFSVYNSLDDDSVVEFAGSGYKKPYDGNLARGDFKFLSQKVDSEAKSKLFELFRLKNPEPVSQESSTRVASSLNSLNITNSSKNLIEDVEVQSDNLAVSDKGTGRDESYARQVARESYEQEVKDIKSLLEASQGASTILSLDSNANNAPKQTMVANVEPGQIKPEARKINEKIEIIARPESTEAPQQAPKQSMFDKKVWQVQVYSASSIGEARKKWLDLQKVTPELFLDQKSHILEANVEGKMYYRLRIGYVHSDDGGKGYFETKSQAVNFCNLLRDEGVDCYPTLTDFKVLN